MPRASAPPSRSEGHNAQQCAKDAEAQTWLYDSVHEAIVERLELGPTPTPPYQGPPASARAVGTNAMEANVLNAGLLA